MNLLYARFARAMPLLVYQHNFWPGFVEGTDPNSIGFFLTLLSRVFGEPVEHTTDLDKAEILLESIGINFGGDGQSKVQAKKWRATILFSGESVICSYSEHYDCILWGRHTEGRVVCFPLFLSYLMSSGAIEPILERDVTSGEPLAEPPKKRAILVVISNPGGPVRNAICEELEKHFEVHYAGKYNTNRPVITAPYHTAEFRREVAQYRCILSAENSQDTNYLTEKITHGLCSGIVPIYWGATDMHWYFNQDRMVRILDPTKIPIEEIRRLMEDDNYYMEKINKPMFMKHDSPISAMELVETELGRIVAEMRERLGIQI